MKLTQEQCLEAGGHCWEEYGLPQCYGDNPDYPVEVRTCRHCEAREVREWKASDADLIDRALDRPSEEP